MRISIRRGSIITLTLFLYAMGFLGAEKYIVALLLAELTALLLLSKRNLLIFFDEQIIPLILWCLSYTVMCIVKDGEYITNIIYYFAAPMILYCLGKVTMQYSSAEKSIVNLIIAVSIGFFIHGFADIIVSIYKGTFENNAEFIYDIWRKVLNNRTIIGLYLTPIVCISIPLLFVKDEGISVFIRALLVLLTVLSLLSSIYIGNRSILVITAILVLAGMIFGYTVSENKRAFITVCILIFTAVIISTAVNLFGLKTFVNNSFLSKRSAGGLSSLRWKVYADFIKHFIDYSGGWITIGDKAGIELRWAHNIWIDICIFGGWFPFACFIWYTIRILKDVKRLFHASNCRALRAVITLFTLGILLNWAVEPILDANPYYFSVCCFIFSMFGAKLRLLKARQF